MDVKELRKKSPAELNELVSETRRGIQQLRFEVSLRQESNVRKLRKKKKDLAQILTLITESTK